MLITNWKHLYNPCFYYQVGIKSTFLQSSNVTLVFILAGDEHRFIRWVSQHPTNQNQTQEACIHRERQQEIHVPIQRTGRSASWWEDYAVLGYCKYYVCQEQKVSVKYKKNSIPISYICILFNTVIHFQLTLKTEHSSLLKQFMSWNVGELW